MAIYSIADMSTAMPSTIYRKMVGQVQRKAVTLRVLSQAGALRRSNTGQFITWDVKFTGQDAGAVNMDGGSLRTAASDVPVPTQLGFGSYAAPVKVTDDLLWRGGASAGLGSDINPLTDAVAMNIRDGVEKWVKVVNVDLYAATGSANTLTGFSSAVAPSGIYANINQSTQSGWASTVQGNSGTLRSLTLALMKTHRRTIAVASRMGGPDMCFSNGALMDAIETLFESYTRINYQPSAAPGIPAEKVTMNPSAITTAGGKINRDGFRAFYWENQGMWFIEDPDQTGQGFTNAANALLFLNSADVELQYLPPPGANAYLQDRQVLEAAEQDMGPLAGMQLELIKRGRTQYAHEFDMTGKIQLVVNSRNAHGWLQDVQ